MLPRQSAHQRRLVSAGRALAVVVVSLAGGAVLCMGTGWWFWEWFHSPDIVARVLFCETANCTPHERLLVAGVMKNRIGRPVFGTTTSLRDVVEQPGASPALMTTATATGPRHVTPPNSPRRSRRSGGSAWHSPTAIFPQSSVPRDGRRCWSPRTTAAAAPPSWRLQAPGAGK